MIIVMKTDSKENNIKDISKLLKSLGLDVHISKGTERTIIGVIGDKQLLNSVPIDIMPGVEKLVPIMESYKLASRAFCPEPSIIDIKGAKIGGKELVIMGDLVRWKM